MNSDSLAIEQNNFPSPAPLSMKALENGLHAFTQSGLAHELGMWLRAGRSFFKGGNHPLAESERARITERDWANELRIIRRALLRGSQLTLRMMTSQKTNNSLLDDAEETTTLGIISPADVRARTFAGTPSRALVELSESLGDACAICEALLETRSVSFHTWISFGNMLVRELERSEAAKNLMQAAYHRAVANLQAPLLDLTRRVIKPAALGADMLIIFNDLTRLLDHLRFIEDFLQRDLPLKQTLPIFSLIHEDAQTLLNFIETRALRTEGMDQPIFDALDGTNYAISMEVRKVFSRELMGLSALRQAPPIYVKIENAHGLLRDCFQLSIVGLAQLFDETLDAARLFNSYQNKLEQSLALRRDLWVLLQLVRRAREEREAYPISRLLERLTSFGQGSLRYLMYKDWEACERFIEEVAAARGAAELGPVLHRFATYLETLHEHVSMRSVLSGHPFDYPALDE